jgi:hypothetical protein
MTDSREIQTLTQRLQARGGVVTIRRDADGYVAGVSVANVCGIGPHEMAPLSFAERARAVLAAQVSA